jgi:ABC-type phosphate transport system substrate-binding protein
VNQLFAAVILASMAGAACADEIAVIVNPKNPLLRLSNEEASAYFLGRALELHPIDQSDGAPIRDAFYRKVVGKEPARVKAIWSKLVFTGKGVPPTQVGSSAEVKRAVAADPLAIGYIERGALDASVKMVLSVD